MSDRKRPTLMDVARVAAVGIATVDRVLNARARVAPATAARVLEAAERVGYHAHRLMRRRVEEMAAARRLGFVLQKQGKWFYQTLAAELERAADRMSAPRVMIDVTFVESLAPEGLADAIADLSTSCDALGVVAVDHPAVSRAIAASKRKGVPVMAMLSPLSAPDITGFVGVDGRKAGRTAGWAMRHLLHRDGPVGMLVGSHRYLGHEAMEAGFRGYMREVMPDRAVRDSMIYLDDAAVAQEATAALLDRCPDLAGIYHCGGGAGGAIRAIEAAGRAQDLVYICHEEGPSASAGLIAGTVDMLIATPIRAVAETVVHHLGTALTDTPTDRSPDTLPAPLPFRLVTVENMDESPMTSQAPARP